MKTIQKLFFTSVLMLCCIVLKAQSTTPMYFVVETMKSNPNKTAEYVKMETDVWKKIHMERVKRGLIVSWSFYEVVSPSGTANQYDFITVTAIQGFEKLENSYGTLFDEAEKILGKADYDKAMAASNLRDLTTTSISKGLDFVAADPKNTINAKYLVVNYMKVKDANNAAYENLEMKYIKPMHAEMMKTGGRAAWGLYKRVMPGGEDGVFNYSTVDFYNNWADINKNGDYQKAGTKLFPKENLTALSKQLLDVRTLSKNEVWRLISSTN
jgi:hypothetical protein